MNIACNCLVGLGGRDEGAGPWCVEVDDHTGSVADTFPLDGKERPFTQWLGGTVVISPANHIKPSDYSPLQPLSQWIALLTAPVRDEGTALVVDEGTDRCPCHGYAWHSPACSPDAIVACPRLVKKNSFIS